MSSLLNIPMIVGWSLFLAILLAIIWIQTGNQHIKTLENFQVLPEDDTWKQMWQQWMDLLPNYCIEEADDWCRRHVLTGDYLRLYRRVFMEPEFFEGQLRVIQRGLTKAKSKPVTKGLEIGSGVGWHYRELRKLGPIVGMDTSSDAIQLSRSSVPDGVFVQANAVNPRIWKEKQFSHIFMMQETLFWNVPAKQNAILQNVKSWLEDDGFLITTVWDTTQLDNGPRKFSRMFGEDPENDRRAITFYPGFRHEAWWKKPNKKGDPYVFEERVTTEDNKWKRYRHPMWFPDGSVDVQLQKFRNAGFVVISVNSLKEIGLYDQQIVICRKK